MDLDQHLRRVATPYERWLPERPEGMTGEDIPLYSQWRARPIPTVQTAFFNVRVGPAFSALAAPPDLDTTLAAQLLALRVDAVVWDGRSWWVIEYHSTASLAQFGRAIAYPQLLARTYGSGELIRSIIVARTVNPFLLPLFTEHQVAVLLYEAGATQAHLVNPEALAV